MKNWFEYEEGERIKKVYSKYSISSFWNWWSSGQNKVMEVRIKNYELIKSTAERFKLPWSASGVYVNNPQLLINVISFVREKATCWFGLNPRKKAWNKYGKKGFGGSDVNIDEVGFIFVDIDRIKKDGVATNNDLEKCDVLAEKVLNRLSREGWNKSYIKICSGHGVQLIIKLDFPVKMPEIEYDSKTKMYVPNEEYERTKEIIRKGIGMQISRFCRKFKAELMVDLDKSGFNVGRVAALPVTKNFKYNTFKWRGIVELVDEENLGLTDYVLSKWENLKLYENKNVFVKSRNIGKERIRVGKLMKHRLAKAMLEYNWSEGGRNNYLWFQFKCLVRDSNIKTTSKEFRTFHQLLEKKWNDKLPTNFPDKKHKFDKNVVNAYFIMNCVPPIYKVLSNRTKRLDVFNDWNMLWENSKFYEDDYIELKPENNEKEDIFDINKQIEQGKHIKNKVLLSKFLYGFRIKYGDEKARYYYKYLFERYFSWK